MSKRKQIKYLKEYKEMKAAKAIDFNVKGLRSEKGLKDNKYLAYKVHKAYKQYSKLGIKKGSNTILYKPNRKRGESNLAYKRRVNKISRQNGINTTTLNGIPFERLYAKQLKLDKDNMLIIKGEDKLSRYEKKMIPIDRVAFNKDPEKYLQKLMDKYKGSDFTFISPIHSHWVGDGAHFADPGSIANLINRITGWANQYKIKDDSGRADKLKDDNFLTGFFIETYQDKSAAREIWD